MSFTGFAKLAVIVVGALSLALLVLAVLNVLRPQGRRENPVPEPPPPPSSLSILAGLSFFCGLAAIGLVTATGILSLVLSMGDLLGLPSEVGLALELSGKIAQYASLLPTVAAAAFALAARGVISESRGTVRGKPLYRTGLVLAIIAGVVVADVKVITPSNIGLAETVARVRSVADLDRGYLGVEQQTDVDGSLRILRVVPGSPAEKAGLKTGDRIVELDGTPALMVSFPERIASLKPGTRVAISVLRGEERISVVAELVASFENLLALIETQAFDSDRLAILTAAGLDRRYTAEELTKICETFDMDGGRLKAIESALPHLQDPQNAYKVLAALDFSGTKEKVSGWIAERARSRK